LPLALVQTQARFLATSKRMNLTKVQTAKAFFLLAAFISLLLSVGLWFSGYKDEGLFVGIWVPSICSAGALMFAGGSID